ncbi:MAG TPA: hypothetical protein VGR34_06640, partial [Candidatus Dormibacteraeota bacterium]|nr:hypothetical protein [Candidatus Dormibacteraeota bacterium]
SYAAPDKFGISIAAPVTIENWIGELAGPAKRFSFSAGDISAPPKLFPPAPVTLNHWTPTLGVNALPQPFDRGSYAAPDKFGISIAAPVTIENWIGELAGPAKRFSFSAGDTFSAPAKTLPPAPITLSNWFGTDGCKAVVYIFSLPDGFAAPPKFDLTVAVPIFPTVCAQAAQVRLAMEALVAELAPAMEAQAARVRPAMIGQSARVVCC